eukprot:COSAG01_NODE_5359_length_4310_cov_55.597720_2_plen_173_part_00
MATCAFFLAGKEENELGSDSCVCVARLCSLGRTRRDATAAAAAAHLRPKRKEVHCPSQAVTTGFQNAAQLRAWWQRSKLQWLCHHKAPGPRAAPSIGPESRRAAAAAAAARYYGRASPPAGCCCWLLLLAATLAAGCCWALRLLRAVMCCCAARILHVVRVVAHMAYGYCGY